MFVLLPEDSNDRLVVVLLLSSCSSLVRARFRFEVAFVVVNGFFAGSFSVSGGAKSNASSSGVMEPRAPFVPGQSVKTQ